MIQGKTAERVFSSQLLPFEEGIIEGIVSNDKAGGSLGVWCAGFSVARITHYMTIMNAERMERAAWEVRLERSRKSMMSRRCACSSFFGSMQKLQN